MENLFLFFGIFASIFFLTLILCLTKILVFIQLADMVHFRDYTSLSSKIKYLLIEAGDGTVLTRLLTETPIVGKSADPWPPLQNSLHMLDWTSEHDIGANWLVKVWLLRTPNQCQLNIASTLSWLRTSGTQIRSTLGGTLWR